MILLEYKTLELYKNNDFEEKENKIHEEDIQENQEDVSVKFLNGEIPNILEGFENKKKYF